MKRGRAAVGWSAALFVVVSSVTSGAAADDLPLPGPAPRDPVLPIEGVGAPTDARCADCHAEIALEWRASLHRRAWVDPYFARAYAFERTGFCRKCHAPTDDPSVDPSEEARAVGVACTTCHVVGANVVGSRALAAVPGGHVVIGDARLATPAACAGCHSFPFPGPPDREPRARMQDTLAEHERSAAAAKACQHCHMPRVPSRDGGTHRNHSFAVQADPSTLARAVEVRGVSLAAGALRISIAPGVIGHAFPTGDVYRQVEVRATPVDASGRPRGRSAVAVLGRRFGTVTSPRGPARVQLDDTRLDRPRTIDLALPPTTTRARWQVVWQRMPPRVAEFFRMDVRDQEVVVAEGVATREVEVRR